MNIFVKFFKRLYRKITSNKFILYVSLILNILLWITLTVFISKWIYAYIIIAAIFITIIVVAKSKDPLAYKFSWIIVMVVLPLFGTVFYLYMKSSPISIRKQKAWRKIQEKNEEFLELNNSAFPILKKIGKGQERLAHYVQNTTGMPVYANASAQYFKTGEEFFDNLFIDLEKAESFIYLEYFIVRRGQLWDKLYSILSKKAQEGVKIKFLYDDYGCVDVFTRKERKRMREDGVELKPFNKLRPYITRFSNYRDHRKIVIIDGKIAYTGGMNMADEYANIIERFGYWKDTGIKIKNSAVHAFMVLFATNWQIATKEKLSTVCPTENIELEQESTDIVQIFGSGPLDTMHYTKCTYDNMINSAKEHLYISTPYFILDESTRNALKNAALSGVKIKILLPGIPDKNFIYSVGRSFYRELLEQGIEIYELNGSFNHAKMVEIDGATVAIGTANFDFRSLYLHFEDTVMLYKSKAITDIKNDFEDLFKKSQKIEISSIKNKNFFKKIYVNFIKLFLPLL